jgi:hypothetical protein
VLLVPLDKDSKERLVLLVLKVLLALKVFRVQQPFSEELVLLVLQDPQVLPDQEVRVLQVKLAFLL